MTLVCFVGHRENLYCLSELITNKAAPEHFPGMEWCSLGLDEETIHLEEI